MSDNHGIDRRDFIRRSAVLFAASAAGVRLVDRARAGETLAPGSPDSLRGFVVADAHFGWDNSAQPAPEAIAKSIDHIMERFPGLDLFVDAGDATHSQLPDDARGLWTDHLQARCASVPFFYTTGNHEITVWGKGYDTEYHMNRMGSCPCRPYYSYDLKGVHFVSLPELMTAAYVTDEELVWLELDLNVHHDTTTIIFSHNAIKGTTLAHDDPGYRRLANSRRVFDLLRRYPNVIAWMHGHNHTWEIVRKAGKLFVSCGRIGGFSPTHWHAKFGGGHLGGMYFEVAPGHCRVRGYSVTEGRFFDELEGFEHLDARLETPTTFDADAAPSFSYGYGGARDGLRTPVFNHVALAAASEEIVIGGAPGPVISENPQITCHYARWMPSWHIKGVPGYSFLPRIWDEHKEDHSWDWLNPGVVFYALEGETKNRSILNPEHLQGDRGYYRVAPGRKYTVEARVESADEGPKARIVLHVHDRDGERVFEAAGDTWSLQAGEQRVAADFGVPSFSERRSIYTDPESDNIYHASIILELMDQTCDVVLKRLALTLSGAGETTIDPSATVDGTAYRVAGEMLPGVFRAFPMNRRPRSRSVIEAGAGGSGRMSWIVRQRQVRWQVRNAVVSDAGEHLEIGPLRNTFSPRNEIVIVPLADVGPAYVWRLRNVNRARVWQPIASGEARIELIERLGPVEIEMVCAEEPVRIEGAESWSHSGGVLVVRAGAGDVIEIEFRT